MIYDIDGNPMYTETDDGIHIKSYFEGEMADTVSKVKALQTEPCVIIPICTDIHYLSTERCSNNQTFETMIDNMKYLSTKIRLDAVACLGDITDGYTTKEISTTRINHMFDRFRELRLPILFASGNHDGNGYSGSRFTLDELAKTQYSNNYNGAIFSSGTHNWYWDIPAHKMRLIGLSSACAENNSSTYRYPTGTEIFVQDALTTTPSGYLVVLLEHLAPIASQNWADTVQQNASGVKSAIDSWLEADENHTLISFMGHSHSDYAFTSPWLNVAINCQKTEDIYTEDFTVTQEMRDQGNKGVLGSKHWHNVAGTYKEDCWDVCVIRYNSRKVNMVRFGVGEDREFTY